MRHIFVMTAAKFLKNHHINMKEVVAHIVAVLIHMPIAANTVMLGKDMISWNMEDVKNVLTS